MPAGGELPVEKGPRRVLYMHGLESGPRGIKVRWLSARYEAVLAPDMQTSMWDLAAPNSFARCALRTLATSLPWNAPAYALVDNLERCLQVQAEAIRAFKPDVVVASSWGAAVAQLALARGVWRGPTVLMCPALGKGLSAVGAIAPDWQFDTLCAQIRAQLTSAERARILVVHGDADDVVPIDLSRRFARIAGVDLVEVARGGHKLGELLRTHEHAWAKGLPEGPLLTDLIERVTADVWSEVG